MYKKLKNKIIINNTKDFCPTHIFECGQFFRYKKSKNVFEILSKNYQAKIIEQNDSIEIKSDNVDYFEEFFDLNTNYQLIKKSLNKDAILKPAIEFGYGIRILKQDLFEMIISFIISANNNIKRIQNSIEYICKTYGTKCNEFYAFPTSSQLVKADETSFKLAGTGYRARYLVDTISKINSNEFDLQYLNTLPTNEARKYLITLSGVGPKVADCILLFGMHRLDVFPVDTWIEQSYKSYFSSDSISRNNISKLLCEKYKELSGYAQQYLFYYQRSFIKKGTKK